MATKKENRRHAKKRVRNQEKQIKDDQAPKADKTMGSAARRRYGTGEALK